MCTYYRTDVNNKIEVQSARRRALTTKYVILQINNCGAIIEIMKCDSKHFFI